MRYRYASTKVPRNRVRSHRRSSSGRSSKPLRPRFGQGRGCARCRRRRNRLEAERCAPTIHAMYGRRPVVSTFGFAQPARAFCVLGRDESGRRLALEGQMPTGQLGPIRAELSHRLHQSGDQHGQDLLEARLQLTNTSDKPQDVCSGFVSYAQPGDNPAAQRAYFSPWRHLPQSTTSC